MLQTLLFVRMLLSIYALFCSYAANAKETSVMIIDQRVPGAVLNGTEFVVLDCLFRVSPGKSEGLVVTWYFNNSPSPTYQWISGQMPLTIGPMKQYIRVGYEAPTDDALGKYRAVYLVRPTIELTGNYKCVVSTFSDEDFMIKKMTVYAPGHSMRMKRFKAKNPAHVNISCTISRVFPMPQMHLFQLDTTGNASRNNSLQITMVDYQNDDSGAFDVSVSTILEESQLTRSTVFYCNMIIPSTPYQITKKFVYMPDDSGYLFTDNFAWSNQLSSRMLGWAVIFTWLLFAALY